MDKQLIRTMFDDLNCEVTFYDNGFNVYLKKYPTQRPFLTYRENLLRPININESHYQSLSTHEKGELYHIMTKALSKDFDKTRGHITIDELKKRLSSRGLIVEIDHDLTRNITIRQNADSDPVVRYYDDIDFLEVHEYDPVDISYILNEFSSYIITPRNERHYEKLNLFKVKNSETYAILVKNGNDYSMRILPKEKINNIPQELRENVYLTFSENMFKKYLPSMLSENKFGVIPIED